MAGRRAAGWRSLDHEKVRAISVYISTMTQIQDVIMNCTYHWEKTLSDEEEELITDDGHRLDGSIVLATVTFLFRHHLQ